MNRLERLYLPNDKYIVGLSESQEEQFRYIRRERVCIFNKDAFTTYLNFYDTAYYFLSGTPSYMATGNVLNVSDVLPSEKQLLGINEFSILKHKLYLNGSLLIPTVDFTVTGNSSGYVNKIEFLNHNIDVDNDKIITITTY